VDKQTNIQTLLNALGVGCNNDDDDDKLLYNTSLNLRFCY